MMFGSKQNVSKWTNLMWQNGPFQNGSKKPTKRSLNHYHQQNMNIQNNAELALALNMLKPQNMNKDIQISVKATQADCIELIISNRETIQ